jgi:predicted phage terminase large subunit-like protein
LAAGDPGIYDKVFEWYSSGPRQRLQPGGSIVVVMTRWGKRDLTGQVIKSAAQRGGEEWEVIEFPAILPSGNPLWPEFWNYEELDSLRTELPNSKWQAQYQQNPTSDTSAIVKREWWKIWEDEDPPSCEYTLMSWDTAFEKNNRADYSACTLWGVFDHPDETGTIQSNLILLNAFRDRMEFPELKKCAIDNWKEWSPDSVIIEKKASGAPLIYELRAMGIPVQEYTPVRGNDKISRLNAVSDLFASGRVWAPGTRWADEVIDEVASFPAGEHDDYVDAVSLALMRFRKGGYIRTLLDEEDEQPTFRRNQAAYY